MASSPSKHGLVAIHQPNLFPWLGYFDKIRRAEVFILLDDVQFPKKGGSWINRVRILINGEPKWMTLPVDRSYHGTRRICDMRLDESSGWQRRMVATLRSSYGRAPFFEEVMPTLEAVIGDAVDGLCSFNLKGLFRLLAALEMPSDHMILSSKLAASGQATDLLISLVQAVGGRCYLAGGGASGYQEDEKFAAAGLDLSYQAFEHPAYPQFNSQTFEPGLSIIDAAMNLGFQGTHALLNPGSTASKERK